MIRKISASALLLACLSTPTFAQSMDCEQEYRVRVNRMMAVPKVPIADMIETTRFMIQGYDACMKGDMLNAKTFFEKARSNGN